MGKSIYLSEKELKFLRVAIDEMGDKLGHVDPAYFESFEEYGIRSNEEILLGFESLLGKIEPS